MFRYEKSPKNEKGDTLSRFAPGYAGQADTTPSGPLSVSGVKNMVLKIITVNSYVELSMNGDKKQLHPTAHPECF